jgi:DMSO reductase family type II enzyme chaperone
VSAALSEPERRSRSYARFGEAFRYPGPLAPADAALGLPGIERDAAAAFLEAFDPAVAREACSLHEAAHAGEHRSTLFEELVRFYAHFGLARRESAELPDHVGVELEFMHFLTAREAAAGARGEDVRGLRLAQRDFLARHLSRLAAAIARGAHAKHPHYAALGSALERFVAAELCALGGGAGAVPRQGAAPASHSPDASEPG